MVQTDEFYTPPTAPVSDSESTAFNFERLLAGNYFIEPVIVSAIHGTAPDIQVDVMPMVMQLDIGGSPIPNAVLYNLPVWRLQGGSNAIIIDPVVGDIGIIAVCDKDITQVKSSKAQSSPSTKRRHSKSDAVYLGGILNAAPFQYIEFTSSGINIKSPGTVNINGLQVLPDGRLMLADGTVVDEHTHGGVERGGSQTDPLGG